MAYNRHSITTPLIKNKFQFVLKIKSWATSIESRSGVQSLASSSLRYFPTTTGCPEVHPGDLPLGPYRKKYKNHEVAWWLRSCTVQTIYKGLTWALLLGKPNLPWVPSDSTRAGLVQTQLYTPPISFHFTSTILTARSSTVCPPPTHTLLLFMEPSENASSTMGAVNAETSRPGPHPARTAHGRKPQPESTTAKLPASRWLPHACDQVQLGPWFFLQLSRLSWGHTVKINKNCAYSVAVFMRYGGSYCPTSKKGKHQLSVLLGLTATTSEVSTIPGHCLLPLLWPKGSSPHPQTAFLPSLTRGQGLAYGPTARLGPGPASLPKNPAQKQEHRRNPTWR